MRYFALYAPHSDAIVDIAKEADVRSTPDAHINVFEYIDITSNEYFFLLRENFNDVTYADKQDLVEGMKDRPRFSIRHEITFVPVEDMGRVNPNDRFIGRVARKTGRRLV